MENQIAIQSQNRYLANISNPISQDFKMDVLKMKMPDLVDFVLESKPVSIFKSYTENEEKTADIIMLMLIQFQDFYNCKSKMDKPQLLETAYIIIQQFRHFNYYDIGIALRDAKMREKIYDRVDGGMILEFLTYHDINRTGMIVTKREQQKSVQDGEWSALGERSSFQSLKDYLR
tara:strand:+ start:2578 stop:3102 length:525 start_codon:yes stop_codon:yes gene_type:complete